MRCPFCGHESNQVKDSRPAEEGGAIRRRRMCDKCGARFTTYERVQLRDLMVEKSTGAQEAFDRDKLIRSLKLALRKRPIDNDQIELAANSIVRQLETTSDGVISTQTIGQKVMSNLYHLDKVAYVRYGSVYYDFNETDDFNAFIEDLHTKMKKEA